MHRHITVCEHQQEAAVRKTLDELGFDPSESDYKIAFKKIETLFDTAGPDTSESDAFERLAALV